MRNAIQVRPLALLCATALALAALVAVAGAQQEAAPPKLEIRKITERVYAALQPAGLRFDDCNATIVLLEDGVLVADTHGSLAVARQVIAEIRKLTPRPVRYVVNTHWHGDHVQGNSAYRQAFPKAIFIAQRRTREDIEKRALPELREEQKNLPGQIEAAEKQLGSGVLRNGQPMSDEQKRIQRNRIDRAQGRLPGLLEVKDISLPELTFENTLTIYDGAREVRLLHFPGHTDGDVALLLPAERVLVTGDLLDDLPYTGHGSPGALVTTLRAMAALDWDVMIPGHGSVRRGKEHLELVAAAFDSLVKQVQEAAKQGASLEDTRKRVQLDAFREKLAAGDDLALRHWNGFIPAAIDKAWQEATGKKE
jgi:glyoxylase-like metal-dependent hydrolase (beta-lactamase superfamily II)